MKFYPHRSKKAQVWIETVLYTLIAFSIIGLVLAYARPEIQRFQDESTVKESIILMSKLDSKILEVSRDGEGNRRVLDISIKKGSLNINAIEDTIILEIESASPYTEPGQEYFEQGISILTTKMSDTNNIRLLKNYSGTLNITYNGKEENKTIPQSPNNYAIYVENKGEVGSSNKIIELGLM